MFLAETKTNPHQRILSIHDLVKNKKELPLPMLQSKGLKTLITHNGVDSGSLEQERKKSAKVFLLERGERIFSLLHLKKKKKFI